MTSMSVSVADPSLTRSSRRVISPQPYLHDRHCPHDSTYKKREKARATSTGQALSSYRTKPALPTPSPAAAKASYDKGVPNRSGGITGLATPEKQPSHDRAASAGPPAAAITSVNAVPMSTSTTHGAATSPT